MSALFKLYFTIVLLLLLLCIIGGGTSRERSRSLTRIASNPLTGYCGGGNESRLDGRGTKMLAAWWAEYKRRQVPDVDESLLESIIDSDSRRSAGDNETDSVTKRKKKQKKKSNQNKSDNTSTSNSDSVNKTIADSTTIAETVGALLEESVGRLQNGEPLMTVAPMLLAGKQQLAKLRDQTDHRLKSLDMVMTDGSLENDSSNSSDISSSNGDTSIKYGAFKDSIANPENSTDVAMDPLSLARKHRADQQHAAQILTQLEDAVAEMERELMEAYPETATEYSDFMQKHANDEISVQPLDEDDNGDDDEEEDSASNDDEPDLGSDFRRRELDADLRQSMAQIQSISARPNAVLFVSGTNEPELEQRIRTQLDEMSPPLTLSDSLQAKALRLALSIGVDLVAVDSDVLLTVTEPCTLLPEDLIVASDSEAVFSYFTLPPPKKSTE